MTGQPRGLFEDFEEGEVMLHSIGHAIGESEHMQLTDSQQPTLHFDVVYCRERDFRKTRVVKGGSVFLPTVEGESPSCRLMS